MGDLHRRHPPQDIYPREPWRLVETHFDERYLAAAESLFATANGYLGMRGTCDEGQPVVHNGTYVNGFHETWPIVYGEEAYGFAKLGQTIVDVPDAKIIRLYVDDEPFFLPTRDAGGFRAGARLAGRYAGSGARLGAFLGSARLHSVAAPRLAGTPASGRDRVRGHAAGERRTRRHRVGSRRQRTFRASQRRPAHPAVRLRGARYGGDPHRRGARGPRLRHQVERDDAVLRHRSRGADRLLVQREGIGRRGGRPRGLFHRRHGRYPGSGSSSTSPTTRRAAARSRSSASVPSGSSIGRWRRGFRICSTARNAFSTTSGTAATWRCATTRSGSRRSGSTCFKCARRRRAPKAWACRPRA